MGRVYIFTRFERLWHWCQALLIIGMLVTGFEIPVEGLSFTLDVAGEPFARGVGNKPVTIPALGEALVEVKATAGIAGLVMRQFKNLGKGLDKLEYRLKGRLVTGNFGGYDFDQKGELDPAKLFRDGRPAKAPSEQF